MMGGCSHAVHNAPAFDIIVAIILPWLFIRSVFLTPVSSSCLLPFCSSFFPLLVPFPFSLSSFPNFRFFPFPSIPFVLHLSFLCSSLILLSPFLVPCDLIVLFVHFRLLFSFVSFPLYSLYTLPALSIRFFSCVSSLFSHLFCIISAFLPSSLSLFISYSAHFCFTFIHFPSFALSPSHSSDPSSGLLHNLPSATRSFAASLLELCLLKLRISLP